MTVVEQHGEGSGQNAKARATSRLLLGLVLAATFLIYARTLSFEFVHDDPGQIVGNPAVHSWRYLGQYFTAHAWAGVYPEKLGNYYRPLFLIWLRLNDMVWGANPWGWHLTTVLLHVAATGLVYLLALRLTGGSKAALAAAAVFGAHPIHLEGVAWISGVTEPMLAVLFILAFLLYMKSQDSSPASRLWWTASLGVYALALLTKETAIILPLFVFMYESLGGAQLNQTPGKGNWRENVRRGAGSAVPYLVLIAPYLIARFWALGGMSHDVTPMSLAELIYTWPALGWFWIRHLIWPVGLSTYYDFPVVHAPGLRSFVVPLLGLFVLAAAASRGVRRSRQAAFAGVWLFVPLLPLLNLRIFLPDDFAHDRYLYLPSVGFALLVGLGVRKLTASGPPLLRRPGVQLAGLAGAIVLLGSSTIRQYAYFANNLTFYGYSVAVAPRNLYAKTNLAVALGERGELAEARHGLEEVLRTDPNFFLAVYNAGYFYYRLGDYAMAEQTLRQALRLNSGDPETHLYLGLADLHLGRIEAAEQGVRQAIRIRDSGFGYHFALGVILKTRGELAQAANEFRKELAYYPSQKTAALQLREIEGRVRADKE